jgi:putative flippase GtrA
LEAYTGLFPATYSTAQNYDNYTSYTEDYYMTYTSDIYIAAGASGYSLSFCGSYYFDYFYVYSASTNIRLFEKSGSFGGTNLTVTSSTGIYFQLVTDVSQVYFGVDVTVTPVCSSGSFIDGTSNCCAAGSFK